MIKELIPVEQGAIGEQLVRTVNARELHSFLEVGRDFSNWIKGRIEKYEFRENQDYVLTFTKTGERKNVKMIEYHLILDMAKELSMLERNEKGKQARQYFIKCERLVHENQRPQIPQKLSEALRLAANQHEEIEAQQQQIAEMKPKADFWDDVSPKSKLTLSDYGRILKDKKRMSTGAIKIFEQLRLLKIIQQTSSKPYDYYVDRGWFEVGWKLTKPDKKGERWLHPATFITKKGMLAVYAKLKETLSTTGRGNAAPPMGNV